MKTIIAVCIPLLLAVPVSAEQSRLSKEQAGKIALLVIDQPKYREWVSWYSRCFCEAPSYDQEKRLWSVPNPSPIIDYGAGGAPFFEIRDADGYFRIGRGDLREKTKFQMSPRLRKQIESIATQTDTTNATGKKPKTKAEPQR